MQNSLSVITHYFLGVGALLAFLAALLLPKGKWWHRMAGRVAVALYILLIITGLLAGLLYHFYNDYTLKMMLWMQTFFAVSLLVQAISTQRNKKDIAGIKRLNLPLAITSFIAALCTAIAGAMVSQPISCSFGIMIGLLAGKNILMLYSRGENNYNWVFFHSSAMITAGAMLLLNGTGFFGVHDVMDAHGSVSWCRVLESFAPFIIALLVVDAFLYRKYIIFKIPV